MVCQHSGKQHEERKALWGAGGGGVTPNPGHNPFTDCYHQHIMLEA